jgi:hypothetical protein
VVIIEIFDNEVKLQTCLYANHNSRGCLNTWIASSNPVWGVSDYCVALSCVSRPQNLREEGLSPVQWATTECLRIHSKGKVKVKLSLRFFNWARHEDVLGEWRYSTTHSLTSALNRGGWSASRPGLFTPGERAPRTHWIGSFKLVSMLRMCGAIPPIPQYVLWRGTWLNTGTTSVPFAASPNPWKTKISVNRYFTSIPEVES